MVFFSVCVLSLALIQSFSFSQIDGITITSVTSLYSGSKEYLLDGDDNTRFGTDSCYPTGWIELADCNIALGICEAGLCTSSAIDFNDSPSTSLNNVTSGLVSDSSSIQKNMLFNETMSWMQAWLPAPTSINRIYLRGQFSTSGSVLLLNENEDILKSWPFAADAVSIPLLNDEVDLSDPVASVRVEMDVDHRLRGYCYAGCGDCSSFKLNEIALLSGECEQGFDIQLPGLYTISHVTFNADGGGIENAIVRTSMDGVRWTDSASVPADEENDFFSFELHQVSEYINVRASLIHENYHKTYFWNLTIFGEEITGCPSDCSEHGSCHNDVCICSPGYSSIDCSEPALDCNNHGEVIDGACVCDVGWSGDDCAVPMCSFDCHGRGTCIAPGVCQCNGKHAGFDCRLDLFGPIDDLVYLQDRDIFETIVNDYGDCSADAPFSCGSGCAISRGACNPPSEISMDGVVVPFLEGTVSVSSNLDAAPNIIDGSSSTFWQSSTCYPSNYISREDMNGLLGQCEGATACRSSSSPSDIASVTDGSTSTNAEISVTSGQAWVEVDTRTGMDSVQAVSVHLKGVDADVHVLGISPSGTVSLGTLTSSDKYSTVRIDVNDSSITGIRLESDGDFTLAQVATQMGYCTEWAMLDLGKQIALGGIRSRHVSSDDAVKTTYYEVSADGSTWNIVAEVDPAAPDIIDIDVSAHTARYVRIRHVLDNESAKVYVWELDVYDSEGRFGAPPAPSYNPRTMAEILGVNGIWGWGSSQDGDLPENAEYINSTTFAEIGMNSARNYHSANWDVETLAITPDYDNMPGSLQQSWLDWDYDYGSWQQGGLVVQASIRISFMDEEMWDPAPYTYAYNYGYAFARHFGCQHGTCNVEAIEVGNEPNMENQDFPMELYAKILKGMAQGVKDADPSMQVMAGHLRTSQDLADALSVDTVSLLDAMNIHAYSFRGGSEGKLGEHPESIVSSFRKLNQFARFRDINMPGQPLYLTEWGWDSEGANEACTSSTCVSEQLQALYLVRGAMIAARAGVERANVFFYANTYNCGTDKATIFSCSGLVESKTSGFAPKAGYYALRNLTNELGDHHFSGVIREDSTAYVYAFKSDSEAFDTYAAWLPTRNATGGVSVALPAPSLSVRTIEARSLDGQAVSVSFLGDSFDVELSATPVFIHFSADSGAPWIYGNYILPMSFMTVVVLTTFVAPKFLPRERPLRDEANR
eukprot:gnl/Chilomastix_cuspidata/2964.p1 GENE.gnl/Chilomastix_cuspidata/2964~~gnl/Chilomastix_cuspidata/2964.p1  ORF type:complete len:1213 (+),score=69.53 gnl/Chilomastix_cuspidata/2964:83-3721(+)